MKLVLEAKAAEIEAEDRKEAEQRTQAELKSAWDQNLLKEVEANPELKDSSTKLYKIDRKSTRLNSSHSAKSRMPSSA